MKKKLLSIIAAITLCILSFSAYAENGDVSISFRIGDSTLMINGNPVEVEKPFIQGVGTTLVPLRVITEAFGSAVDWEPQEKKITLSYPDVKIVLQIDNKYAEVNSHTEELPEAPVLSENGVTMVPLRFISDTFGADVFWDNGLITVTKTVYSEFGEMVAGMADSDTIGDSYYGWTMNNPKSMLLSYRDFDGSYLSFAGENYDYIDIYFSPITDESPSFDDYFSSSKSFIEGYALTRQDKRTDEKGNQYFVIQAKFENDYIYNKCYYTNDNCYELYAEFTAEDAEKKDAFLAILESFSISALPEGAYDLSDVDENGTREYKNEKYKISINVPANFYKAEEGENQFAFASSDDDSTASVQISIYSKSEDTSALAFAEHDSNIRKKYGNPKFVTISDIVTEEINGVTVHSYTSTVSGSSGLDGVDKDYFLENGDYLYNCTVNADSAEAADKIFATFKTETLDAGEIGTLIRNYGNNDENITVKSSGWSFLMPGNWTTMIDATETGAMITNYQSVVMFMNIPAAPASPSLEESIKQVVDQQTSQGHISVLNAPKKVTVDGKTYYTATLKSTEGGKIAYTTIYMGTKGSNTVAFLLSESEIVYNSGSMDDLKRMMTSLK